ncbi:cathepsin L1-like [Anguilla anguilla]|uniref:cathepsin L1-like n=1 Tax=Anguilla anguilla TaxID=7936 RepID=UPI0015AA1EA0|nr:cathepsin L1-like [Anguilla anguilla]
MHALQNVFLLVLGIISHASSHLNLTLNGQWKDWKDHYNKEYGSQGEELQRRQIWEKNLRMVEKHNMDASHGLHSFTMGLNHLSDMMAEEVNAVLNGLRDEEEVVEELHRHGNLTFTLPDDGKVPLPRSVDWRRKGMVSPVRDQGHCGSCWAFSVSGAMEGLMKRQTGKLVPLSPQNLLDCSSSYGNLGCNGGYLSKTFRYIIENKGIDSDSSYPYESREGKCRYSVQGRAGYCSGFQILQRGDERALQVAVANVGPVSVRINALPSFNSYRGGVYDDPSCSSAETNHAVLVAGYGTYRGKDFWLVKNSWGTDWGESGFIRMARNRNNQCGIANWPMYPTM